MTNKQIIERIKDAGHEVPGNLNRAKLEALAGTLGVNLEEPALTGAEEAATEEAATEEAATEEAATEEGYDPGRMITPVMAVCAMSGDGAALALPEAGEDTGEEADND